MNNGGNNLLFPPYGRCAATLGFAFLAMTNTSIMVITSAAWRTVTEPALLRHRERSVAIQYPSGT